MSKSVKKEIVDPRLQKKKGTFKYQFENVVEDFTLQYNEQHQVEKVKVGETDLIKEVNSHVNEVGLLNAYRLAIAHGEDPMVKFGKYEAGIPVAVDPNATLDEINEAIQEQSAKYAELAKTLGVSVADLQKAVQNGTIGDLIAGANAPKQEETTGKDGE